MTPEQREILQGIAETRFPDDENEACNLAAIALAEIDTLASRVKELEAENATLMAIALGGKLCISKQHEELETRLSDAHCLLRSAHAAVDPETWPDLSAQLFSALEPCGLPQCQHVKELEAERDAAMAVLAPSMPESGLEDACRQVKQAAISEAGNSEALEARLERVCWVLRNEQYDRRVALALDAAEGR